MPKNDPPLTPALRVLKTAGVAFTPRPYRYEDHGGTEAAARELGVDEHRVVKTLVMRDETGAALLVLMHGDRKVSTKALARAIGVKAITACPPETAQKHTGYQVGGISPFGTRQTMPVFVEQSILELPSLFINAGKRGWLVEIAPEVLTRLLKARPVKAAI
ncbi:MAG: Cys-tRNA(Pro) deacylase [Thermodesulfobacteriota bacterium]